MNKIILPYITTNIGKYQDIVNTAKEIASMPFEIEQLALEVDELQSDSQEEIVHKKAQLAWAIVQRPFLIEDAGMFFEKYHNFPGTFSKYIFKSLGFEGLTKLYQPGDRASFKLVLGYCTGPEKIDFFTGECSGNLVAPGYPHKSYMPYSAIFVPDGKIKTYQELADLGEKVSISFRGGAFKKFVEWYKINSTKTKSSC